MTYLAILDESGTSKASNSGWFLYGGLLLEVGRAAELDKAIRNTRHRAGYPRKLPLKWSFPKGPGSRKVTQASHARAAEEILDTCDRLGARLYVVLTPSLVTERTRRDGRAVKFGSSYILGSIQRFLLARDQHAVVLIDRPPGSGGLSLFEEVITEGIRAGVGGSSRTRHYDRIISTGISSSRTSRLNSAIDVVLGALSFSIHCGASNVTRAHVFYSKLRPLMIRATPTGHAKLFGPWGQALKIRPMRLNSNFWAQSRASARRLILLGEKPPPLDTGLGFGSNWQTLPYLQACLRPRP